MAIRQHSPKRGKFQISFDKTDLYVAAMLVGIASVGFAAGFMLALLTMGGVR